MKQAHSDRFPAPGEDKAKREVSASVLRRYADPKCFVNDLRKGKFVVYVDDPDR
jgi:hypothetical protein